MHAMLSENSDWRFPGTPCAAEAMATSSRSRSTGPMLLSDPNSTETFGAASSSTRNSGAVITERA